MIEKLGNNNKFIGSDPLDLIKFICKEFWEEIFRKKVGWQAFDIVFVIKIFHRVHAID